MKTKWILRLGLIALVGGTFFWYYQKSQQETLHLSYQLRKLKSDQNATIHVALITRDSTWLHLLAEPLSWVIRNELLADNLEEIHRYLSQYVKHESIELMMVANKMGKIISATDKNLEGRSAQEIFSPKGLDTHEFFMMPTDNYIDVYIPIMGFDKKIGVLYFRYQTLHTAES